MIDALAVLLRDRDDLALRVAKVDVEAQKALAENQGVSGFPTIRMYKDGRHDDFYGACHAVRVQCVCSASPSSLSTCAF